jgi:cation:H+ antiporter
VGIAVALPLFVVALLVTLVAAATFARRLDQLGARFGLPEVWIGLATALAADAPEISSALIALIKGAHDASVGVIVGSNTFNLAAMIGVSALLVGSVRVPRKTLLLEGTVSISSTVIVIALLLGWLPAPVAVAFIAVVLAPYLMLVVGGYDFACRFGLRRLAALVLEPDAIEHDARDRAAGHRAVEFATHHYIALMSVDLVLIVAGSLGMVQAALALGHHWGLAEALVGALILGPLTSLPNALTGIRLGSARRGAALVTETLNSNTINLVAGVALPALFVTLAANTTSNRLDLALLAASTFTSTALLRAHRGLRRPGAAVIIGLYAAFVAVTLNS